MTRQFAIRMAKDAPVPERREDPFADNFLWELYKDLDDTKACIKLMQAHLSQFFTFKRPGHNFFKFYCRTMSLGCLAVDYLVHRGVIQELQALNERIEHANLVPLDEISNFGISEHERRRSKLLQLKNEADGRMRKGARELASILWAMQNSLSARTGLGIMTGIGMVYDGLPQFAEILATMPSREEGGTEDFPLETKIQEVRWLLSTYRSLGWSWVDMADAIKYLEDQLARLEGMRSGITAPNPSPGVGLPVSSVRSGAEADKLSPQAGVGLPVSSVRSSAEPSSSSSGATLLPPTPASVKFGPPQDFEEHGGYNHLGGVDFVTGGERPTSGYAADIQAQALAPLNMLPPEAPAHIPQITTSTGASSISLQLTDPFADLYNMTVSSEYLDGTAQAGHMPSPTSMEDLQQWASLFNDQVPLNWEFGHTGFTPQPQYDGTGR